MVGIYVPTILAIQANYHYEDKEINPLIEEAEFQPMRLPIVLWDRKARLVPPKRFIQKVRHDECIDTEAHPEAMLEKLGVVVRKYRLEQFILSIVMGKDVSKARMDEFGSRLKNSGFYSKVTEIHLFMGCWMDILRSLPSSSLFDSIMNLLTKVKIDYVEFVIKKPVDVDIQLGAITAENASNLLNDLAVMYWLGPNTVTHWDKVIAYLKEIEEAVISHAEQSVLFRNARKHCKPANYVRELVKQQACTELKEFYQTLLDDQMMGFTAKKLEVFNSILDTQGVSMDNACVFNPNSMYIDMIDKVLRIQNEQEIKNNSELENYPKDICLVGNLDPDLPMINYPFKHSLIELGGKNVECPLRRFEGMPYIKFGEILTAYNKAGDLTHSDKEMEGIMLYNFQEGPGQDLYEDEKSELYKPATPFDKRLLQLILANLGWAEQDDRGNPALEAISILFSIYLTPKIQQNQFLKKCLRHTILRISLLYKCNWPIYRSEYPHAMVYVHDALMYAFHVSSSDCKSELNFFNRLKDSGPYFYCLMEEIFNQKVPKERSVRDWLAYHFLKDVSAYDSYKRQGYLLDAVVLTSVQNWIVTQSPYPLIIKGKIDNEKYWHCIFKDLTPAMMFKLKKIIETEKLRRPREYHFSLEDIDIQAKVPETDSTEPVDDQLHKHVRICCSTCRPTYLCPYTKRPWMECVVKSQRTRHLSYFELYAHWCSTLHGFISFTDYLSLLSQTQPDKVHHRNTVEVLEYVVEAFQSLDLEFECWARRSLESRDIEKRKQLEADCSCLAHKNLTI